MSSDQYRYGADDIMRMLQNDAPPVTLDQLARTDEIIRLADSRQTKIRPVKAVLRCNQVRWQDQRVCDWKMRIEARSDEIEDRAKFLIYQHLLAEHKSLESRVTATQTFIRDF